LVSLSFLVRALLIAAMLQVAAPRPAAAQEAPTKVSVAILYLTADIGVFLALDRGYFAEQKLEIELSRITSAAEATALLATNRLDVGSGGASPGLFNAFKRGAELQIVADKSNQVPPNFGSGSLLVRRDLLESGQVKTVADLKGKRIALNNIQSTSLNYILRGIALGGLRRDDVMLVEMPFTQFIPGFEKKGIDAAMSYAPFSDVISAKMKLAQALPEAELSNTARGDVFNLMLYSPAFAKTDAATRFMVAHLKAQREYYRTLVQGKGDIGEICRVLRKYLSSTPEDCGSVSLTGVDPRGGVNIASLERYQQEWLDWGIMKEPADIRAHVNESFAKKATEILGPFE